MKDIYGKNKFSYGLAKKIAFRFGVILSVNDEEVPVHKSKNGLQFWIVKSLHGYYFFISEI